MKCSIIGHILPETVTVKQDSKVFVVLFRMICIGKFYNGNPKPPIYANIRTSPINTKDEAEQYLMKIKTKTGRVEVEGIYPSVNEDGFHYLLSKITDCELDREGLLHLFTGTITEVVPDSGEKKNGLGSWYKATYKVQAPPTKDGKTWINYAAKFYNDAFARDNHARNFGVGDEVKVEAVPNCYISKDVWRMSYNIEKIDIIKKAEPVAAPEQPAAQQEPEQVFEQTDDLPF